VNDRVVGAVLELPRPQRQQAPPRVPADVRHQHVVPVLALLVGARAVRVARRPVAATLVIVPDTSIVYQSLLLRPRQGGGLLR